MNINTVELPKKVYDDFMNGGYQKDFASDEEKLAYLIVKQRLTNLCIFLEKQKKKYHMSDGDMQELMELWFLHNDLKELQFIGTDIYSNAMFVRHKVSFLYRSVGKDCNTKRVLDGKSRSDEMGSILVKECLEQIKSGGQGKLFSYSKCFGKMLIKYANIIKGGTETTIEIRKNSWINAILDDNGDNCSIQKYIRMESEIEQEIENPLFLIDMSNARENKVKNLKLWLDTYLGEQSYTRRYNDIYDPIGDAEVITNFTWDLRDNAGKYIMCDEVCRFRLNVKEYCMLLYKYSAKYASENRITNFNDFISTTLKTIPNQEGNSYYRFYKDIVNSSSDFPQIDEILKNIDWENEKKYMTRVKADKSEPNEKIPMIDVYKESNAEAKSRIWKQIVFEALRGHYAYMNCENLRESTIV